MSRDREQLYRIYMIIVEYKYEYKNVTIIKVIFLKDINNSYKKNLSWLKNLHLRQSTFI